MDGTMKNEGWLVQTTPWKGCPFKITLVVITCKGEEEAKALFRKFYSLSDEVEIEICAETPIVKGTFVEDSQNVSDDRTTVTRN